MNFKVPDCPFRLEQDLRQQMDILGLESVSRVSWRSWSRKLSSSRMEAPLCGRGQATVWGHTGAQVPSGHWLSAQYNVIHSTPLAGGEGVRQFLPPLGRVCPDVSQDRVQSQEHKHWAGEGWV